MSDPGEIELDVDVVFPPAGAQSGFRLSPEAVASRRASSVPPALRPIPPPPRVPGAEAGRRHAMAELRGPHDSFERTIRGVIGAQERRIQALERELERSRVELMETRLRLEALEAQSHEQWARNAVAMARIEALEGVRRPHDRDGRRDAEPTQKINHG